MAAVVVAAAVAAAVAVVAEALVELIRGERRESDMDAFVARFNYPLAQGNWAAVRLRKKSDKSEWIALFGSKSTPKLFKTRRCGSLHLHKQANTAPVPPMRLQNNRRS